MSVPHNTAVPTLPIIPTNTAVPHAAVPAPSTVLNHDTTSLVGVPGGSVASLREPSPSRDWLGEITELLLTGGYFRARIPSLDPFDKIIGGLAWSITASNVDVDVDLFYDDGIKTGQKLKLGEGIERALRRMRCPCELQAHQIQGLDYPAIFPVVQWLVKKVMATREELGDRLRSFASYYYEGPCRYDALDGGEASSRARTAEELGSSLQDRYAPPRVLRRPRGVPPPADMNRHVRSVLMEYGHKPAGMASFGGTASAVMAATRWKGKLGKKIGRGEDGSGGDALGNEGDGEEGNVAALARKVKGMMGGGGGSVGGSVGGGGAGKDQDDAESAAELAALAELAGSLDAVCGEEGQLSGSLAARIVGMRAGEIAAAAEQFTGESALSGPAGKMIVVERQIAATERQLEAEEKRVEAARALLSAAEAEASLAVGELDKVKAHNQRCVAETQKLQAMVTDPQHAADIARLMVLVKKHGDIKADEQAFKMDCKKKLGEMQAKLASSELSTLTPAEDEQVQEIEATFTKEEAKHAALRAGVAKRSRAVQLLSRKLDDIPTRPELIQYERRFVELYDTVQTKLAETRRYFDAYNVLTDTKKFLQKEISLLNSLQGQVAEAVKTEEGRTSLVSSLRGIKEGVGKNLDRVNGKLASEQAALVAMQAKFNAVQQRQRQYLTLVKQFQEVCAREDDLRRTLAELKASSA